MPQGTVYPDREKSTDLDSEDVYVKIRAAMLEVIFQYSNFKFCCVNAKLIIRSNLLFCFVVRKIVYWYS